VLGSIHASGLFSIPDVLTVIASRAVTAPAADASADADADEERDEAVKAWDEVMATPFDQIAAYNRYVTGASPFDTHQGIKGREFPRVMVVMGHCYVGCMSNRTRRRSEAVCAECGHGNLGTGGAFPQPCNPETPSNTNH
jgi:hypothetical protein